MISIAIAVTFILLMLILRFKSTSIVTPQPAPTQPGQGGPQTPNTTNTNTATAVPVLAKRGTWRSYVAIVAIGLISGIVAYQFEKSENKETTPDTQKQTSSPAPTSIEIPAPAAAPAPTPNTIKAETKNDIQKVSWKNISGYWKLNIVPNGGFWVNITHEPDDVVKMTHKYQDGRVVVITGTAKGEYFEGDWDWNGYRSKITSTLQTQTLATGKIFDSAGNPTEISLEKT